MKLTTQHRVLRSKMAEVYLHSRLLLPGTVTGITLPLIYTDPVGARGGLLV
jgi:hypothetical protein